MNRAGIGRNGEAIVKALKPREWFLLSFKFKDRKIGKITIEHYYRSLAWTYDEMSDADLLEAKAFLERH